MSHKRTSVGRSVQDLLERQADYNPGRTAIVHEGQEWTYASLDAEANRIGHWLIHVGVDPGDRVLLYAANADRLVAALFGVLKAGAIFVPIHPDTSAHQFKFILENCAPSAIVADPTLLDADKIPISGMTQAVLLTSDGKRACDYPDAVIAGWNVLRCYPGHSPGIEMTPGDLAGLIYTSGSTKNPRGVMEPHRQILFATSAINAVLENGPEDVILCGLPLSFDYGLYQIFLAFQVGAKLVLERDFRFPLAIPRLLRLHGITGFPGVPSLFAMLLRSGLLERIDLPSLRYVTSTGDVFPPAHIRRLQEQLPHTSILPMYGLTECKRVSITPPGQLDGHEGAVGLPLPGTHVSVVDEAGRALTHGMVGELVVEGPHVMAGYWNDPDGTAHRFRRDESTGECVLHTGDLFRMDGDGWLYFMARREHFIKSRGQKVSPAEVESFLCEIEGIAEAGVVGVEDRLLGEAVCAFVSLVQQRAPDSEEIADFCRRGLSPAACPDRIYELDAPLPKTPNSKVDRAKLRSMALRDTNG